MPQIIVTADKPNDEGEKPVMFRERVSVSDFESRHFANQLMERIGWAVGDADEQNRRSVLHAERRRVHRRMVEAARRELALSARPVRPVS